MPPSLGAQTCVSHDHVREWKVHDGTDYRWVGHLIEDVTWLLSSYLSSVVQPLVVKITVEWMVSLGFILSKDTER